MPLFIWNSSYCVGIEEIDNQHKRLMDIMNRLYGTIWEGKSGVMLKSIFAEFLVYAAEHFETEERLMQQYGYPDYIAHKKEHDDCKAKALDFVARLDRDDMVNTIEVCQFFKDWLEDHLAGEDRDYIEFFKAKGLK